jgi:hypothetical protein
MPSSRQTRRPLGDPTGQPFASTVDAWLWFMACHQARLDGARSVAGRGAVARPCEPGDIHRIVSRLYHTGVLGRRHLRVLIAYGRSMLPPDPSRPHHAADHVHWQEALARLEAPLRTRGIVA